MPRLSAVLLGLLLIYGLFSGPTNHDDDHRSRAILIDAKVATTAGYAGCQRLEDTDKFTDLLAAHDSAAAMAYIEQTECELLPIGTAGTVEENSLWHASVCIRQVGRPFCLWVPQQLVQTTD